MAGCVTSAIYRSATKTVRWVDSGVEAAASHSVDLESAVAGLLYAEFLVVVQVDQRVLQRVLLVVRERAQRAPHRADVEPA